MIGEIGGGGRELSDIEWKQEFESIQKNKGELIKEGKTFRLLKKRFFTLRDDSLMYYLKRDASAKAKGIVMLRGCSFEEAKDKKNKQMIRVQGGGVHSFLIWLVPSSQAQLQFLLSFLKIARTDSGALVSSHVFNNQQFASSSQVSNSRIKSPTHKTKSAFQQENQDMYRTSSLHNNPSAIENESYINEVNIMSSKNKRNITTALLDEASRISTNSHKKSALSPQKLSNNNNTNGFFPNPFGFPQQQHSIQAGLNSSTASLNKPGNSSAFPLKLDLSARKSKDQQALFFAQDCDVDAQDDVPNTNYMRQYEFSYQRLENDHAGLSHPNTARNSLSVGPAKRLNMTKNDEQRSKSSKKDDTRQSVFSQHLSAKSGRGKKPPNHISENPKKIDKSDVNSPSILIDLSEINARYGNELTSSSVDYNEEKLYPTRKSLEDFELDDICNDEILHEKMSNQLMTKKSRPFNALTGSSYKENATQILSFKDYEDEDIEDAPPGLAQEYPLACQRMEFVPNNLSQFQNNSKCIDQYKRIRLQKQQQLNNSTRRPSRTSDYCYTEADFPTLGLEAENLSGTRHQFQLKEMFKSHSIITNLQGNVFHPSTQKDPDDYDIYDDDEDDDDDGNENEDATSKLNKNRKIYDKSNVKILEEHIKPDGNSDKSLLAFESGRKKPREVSLFAEEFVLEAGGTEIKLDNEMRVQASQMKLSDGPSQPQLSFTTDTEECLSLVSEHINIEQQINHYQNTGCFNKNTFQMKFEQSLFVLANAPQTVIDPQAIYALSKETVAGDTQTDYKTLWQNLLWSGRIKESNHVLSCLGNKLTATESLVYSVESVVVQLLLSGQLACIDKSIALFSSIINNSKQLYNSFSELEAKAILCEAHMAVGLLKVLQDRKLSALSSINTAHNLLLAITKTIDQHTKNNTEIKFSKEHKNRYLLVHGVFQIGLSLMPGFFTKIFSMLGISVDQKKGIASLTECIEQEEVKSNYARIVLFLYFLEAEANIVSAHSVLKVALSKYSNSPIFNWLASLYFWKLAQSENAVRHMKIAVDLSEKQGHSADFYYFELGWFYLSQLQWSSAVQLFERVIIKGFDFSQISVEKFQKISKDCSTPSLIGEEYKRFLSQFMLSDQEMNGSVKIMHKSVIAFIIGVCFISSEDNQDGLGQKTFQNGRNLVLNEENRSKQSVSIGNNNNDFKTDNNNPNENDNLSILNNDSSQLIAAAGPHDGSQQLDDQEQQNICDYSSTNKLQKREPALSLAKTTLQSPSQQQSYSPSESNLCKFRVWCILALEIYERLGDSRTQLDREFQKIIKLSSKRQYTYLIRYELLYFVKELSKVSDENLDKSLVDIMQYQQMHLQEYNTSKQQSNLIEICSGYLCLVGISYIRDGLAYIAQLSNSTEFITHLSLLNSKNSYLPHHIFYWIAMAFKKHAQYPAALRFFELSRTAKSALFNLSSRIEANIADLLVKIRAAEK